MTMVGDMFNYSLATVNGLCSELSSLLGSRQLFRSPARAERRQDVHRPGIFVAY
jgi:hypothetical protein